MDIYYFYNDIKRLIKKYNSEKNKHFDLKYISGETLNTVKLKHQQPAAAAAPSTSSTSTSTSTHRPTAAPAPAPAAAAAPTKKKLIDYLLLGLKILILTLLIFFAPIIPFCALSYYTFKRLKAKYNKNMEGSPF